MRRRRGRRRKKRNIGILICLLGIACSLPALTASADPEKEPEETETMSNVRSEGYVQLQQPVWNPLQTKAADITADAAEAQMAAEMPLETNTSNEDAVLLLTAQNGMWMKLIALFVPPMKPTRELLFLPCRTAVW